MYGSIDQNTLLDVLREKQGAWWAYLLYTSLIYSSVWIVRTLWNNVYNDSNNHSQSLRFQNSHICQSKAACILLLLLPCLVRWFSLTFNICQLNLWYVLCISYNVAPELRCDYHMSFKLTVTYCLYNEEVLNCYDSLLNTVTVLIFYHTLFINNKRSRTEVTDQPFRSFSVRNTMVKV